MIVTVETAAQLIQEGQVVAVPTETVYGLAASVHNISAIETIYAIKKRPPRKPLSIAISSIEMVKQFHPTLPPSFYTLAEAFWPGPLTLIVPIDPNTIPNQVRANLTTAGFRMPDQPLTLELISKTGPLVLPSANFSDQPEATTPAEVESYFGKDFPVIDGGLCKHGISSTIIAYDNEQWQLIRQGALPLDKITQRLCLWTPPKG